MTPLNVVCNCGKNNDFDVSGPSLSTGPGPREEKGCYNVYTKAKDSSNTENGAASSRIKNDHRIISSKRRVWRESRAYSSI